MRGKLALMMLVAVTATAQDAIKRAGPFCATVTAVIAVPPTKRKQPGLYRVEASSDQWRYTAYCLREAPEAGKVYDTLDYYVSSNYSELHLWAVDRKEIDGATKKRGQMFRVLIFQNVHSGKHPDLACDLRSESQQ